MYENDYIKRLYKNDWIFILACLCFFAKMLRPMSDHHANTPLYLPNAVQICLPVYRHVIVSFKFWKRKEIEKHQTT